MWLAVVAVAHSNAGVWLPLFFAFAGAMILLGVSWMMGVLLVMIGGRNGTPRPSRRSMAVAPAVLLIGVLVATAPPPWLLRLRVRLSAEALVRNAPQLASAGNASLFAHPRRVGLFRVSEFQQFGRELRFITTSRGVVDACGLVFSPDGPPPRRSDDFFSHLYGPWWHWYRSF